MFVKQFSIESSTTRVPYLVPSPQNTSSTPLDVDDADSQCLSPGSPLIRVSGNCIQPGELSAIGYYKCYPEKKKKGTWYKE